MISKKHKTLFVHVPKVAGQSIETLFLTDHGLKWKERGELLLRKKNPGEPGPQRLAHLRARDYVAFGYMDKAEFDDYFKFSFVRDPYRRTYSFYTFLAYDKIMSFKTFVNKILPALVRKDHFFFRPQYEYLYDDSGNLLVDFIGRLENIDEDIRKVIERSGLGIKELPHVNKSKGEWKRAIGSLVKNPLLLFHLNVSSRGKDYQSAVTAAVRDTIYELYKKDFEHFNYPKE